MRRACFALLILGLLTVVPGRNLAAAGASHEVVLEWNRILQATIPAGNPRMPRYYAMMHVAMFDAVNAIEQQYTSFRVNLRRGWGGASEGAAAQAAHDVLVAFIPERTAVFDAALEQRLAGLNRGQAAQGTALGAEVARQIIAWRINDGWTAPVIPYVLPLLPGLWQPAPPANAGAAFTQFPNVVPFAVASATQFLPARPPNIDTAAYAAAFNEVKDIGKSNSTSRPPEQTTISQLFADVGTTTNSFALWNNVAAQVAEARGLSLVDTARLFALVNVSINDGLQTSMASKFIFGLWRPVTAIRAAATDLNDATEADPAWLPLLATPPYPSYAGNQAAIGASAARALANTLGTDDFPVVATWQRPGGPYVLTFDTFSQMAVQQARSREYGGIHYSFDSAAGQQIGMKVADYVFANFMTPR